ncbi:MAG: ATP-binding protein [Candidatus Methanoplasma sp.]|jgi:AAA+ ATPase superfamily predicted ATPase|nr:ATP-binding protein [Candidatus Methanoplasma sp.]
MFVGRTQELKFLEDRFEDPKGQLVVIYGRRRVGKTEILNQFSKDKAFFYHSCAERADREQADAFRSLLLRYADVPQTCDWEFLFRRILDLPPNANGKRLMIIDEFPYMAKGNRAIPSILQNLWDHVLKDENVMIVLCGSSVSFMENEVLAHKNPLYGRATGILKIKQLGFADSAEFFPKYTDLEKVIVYSVLGGVPYYLEMFDPNASVKDNICMKILRRGAPLREEAEFLLRQELRELSGYNAVIAAVATGRTSLNDIVQSAKVDSSKAMPYLTTLIGLDIVQKEHSLPSGSKDVGNASRGIYRLADSFYRSYYEFVQPMASVLDIGNVDAAYDRYMGPRLEEFASLTFEDICREYLLMKNALGGLPFMFSKIGRRWGKDFETDVVATDPHGKNVIFGDCKFKKGPYDRHDLERFVKSVPISEGTHLYLFSRGGFTSDAEAAASENGATLLTLSDIVQEMSEMRGKVP